MPLSNPTPLAWRPRLGHYHSRGHGRQRAGGNRQPILAGRLEDKVYPRRTM